MPSTKSGSSRYSSGETPHPAAPTVGAPALFMSPSPICPWLSAGAACGSHLESLKAPCRAAQMWLGLLPKHLSLLSPNPIVFATFSNKVPCRREPSRDGRNTASGESPRAVWNPDPSSLWGDPRHEAVLPRRCCRGDHADGSPAHRGEACR